MASLHRCGEAIVTIITANQINPYESYLPEF